MRQRSWAGGRSIGATVAALDPVRDHEAIAHLTFGVRYGDPLFVHGAYGVAFARQVASPRIARTVYRTGTGDMMRDVRRRNDHTIVFFGELLRHGYSSEIGGRVLERMEEIHRRFGVRDDDKIFTLGSLAFEGDRVLDALGFERFTDGEREAMFRFWQGVGRRIGLDMPESRAEFLAWIAAYEAENLDHTEAGRAIVDVLFVDWRRWFPGPSRALADPTLLLMMDPGLRAVHRLPDPPALVQRTGPSLVRGYLALQGARPHRTGRSWSDGFVESADRVGAWPRARAGAVDIADYGHRIDSEAVSAPVR